MALISRPASASGCRRIAACSYPGNTRTRIPPGDEYNLNFNYRPTSFLEGILLQLRFGWVNFDETCDGGEGADIVEVRFVTNYAF